MLESYFNQKVPRTRKNGEFWLSLRIEPQTAGGLPFSFSFHPSKEKKCTKDCTQFVQKDEEIHTEMKNHTPKNSINLELLGGKETLNVVGSAFGKRSRGCPRQDSLAVVSWWCTCFSFQGALEPAQRFPSQQDFLPPDQTNVCLKQLSKPGNDYEKEKNKTKPMLA